MQTETFTHRADDGQDLFVYRFLPDAGKKPRAVLHIAHGMAEHAARYARLATALTDEGFAVYANDHRGHGKTTKASEDLGFFASNDGFSRVVRDLEELLGHEKKEHAGLPLVLFGHSMGSYMVQKFLCDHGQVLAGAVLSGTSGKPPALATAGRVLARAERLRLGERGRSKVLHAMSFGQFNAPFKPARTEFDWISRDTAEVDAYAADPLCGFAVTTSLWITLLDALAENAEPERQARIPKDLPIYVFAGSDDPVGDRTKSIDQLLGAYRKAGLRRVEHRYYPGGRHEMLNETNREEVTRDLIAWLARAVPS